MLQLGRVEAAKRAPGARLLRHPATPALRLLPAQCIVAAPPVGAPPERLPVGAPVQIQAPQQCLEDMADILPEVERRQVEASATKKYSTGVLEHDGEHVVDLGADGDLCTLLLFGCTFGSSRGDVTVIRHVDASELLSSGDSSSWPGAAAA
eukprot:2250127-Prymnesium_polylepis.2